MGKSRGWFSVILAAAFLVVLATSPFLFQSQTTPSWVQAAQRESPIPLSSAPAPLADVQLSRTATPANPFDAPASLPNLDSIRMAALVAAEDLRLRTLLHHVNRLIVPEVIPVRGGLPTLVLPGPGSYTITDLVNAGAAAPLVRDGGYLIVDSVLVASGATLKLGGPGTPNLLLESSTAGFASLVTWGGTLSLAGESASVPMAVMGWDRTRNQVATDSGYGRPYIRAVGGQLDLKFVNASSLGFWSGRTGGVAWTGISSRVSTGSAVSSRFTGNTYGAFVSRSSKVQFTDDLFEANELDGLRLHRNAIGSTVTASAAVRNGGNGFVVSRGATGAVLKGNLALRNQGNGFLLNGQPLVTGASPPGRQAVVSIGTVVQDGEADGNGRTGILVEGGAGTLISNNIVCSPVTGIAIRAGATVTSVIGNEVRCGGRIALSIGPAVTGTTVSGNLLSSARIGLLIRNSAGVRVLNNRITGMSIFGISVRGLSPGVVGSDNFISGRGFRPVDIRGGANAPLLTTTDVSAWQHRSQVTLASYLRFHPILSTWLVILFLTFMLTVIARFSRWTPSPYDYTFTWQRATHHGNGVRAAESSAAMLADTSVVASVAGAATDTPNGALLPNIGDAPAVEGKRVLAHGATRRRGSPPSVVPVVGPIDG